MSESNYMHALAFCPPVIIATSTVRFSLSQRIFGPQKDTWTETSFFIPRRQIATVLLTPQRSGDPIILLPHIQEKRHLPRQVYPPPDIRCACQLRIRFVLCAGMFHAPVPTHQSR